MFLFDVFGSDDENSRLKRYCMKSGPIALLKSNGFPLFLLSGSILGGVRGFGLSVEATYCTDNRREHSLIGLPRSFQLTALVSVRRAFAK